MMAEGGEQTISLVEVAERAGVTRGTVYHHFRCRNELIRAASDSLERTMEAIAFGTWEHDDPYGEPAAQAARDPVAFRSHLRRSEEHTSELQSLMRISYAVFCLKTTK